jgi:xanthosine utilization system XapX-like protein
VGFLFWGGICAGICYWLAKRKNRNPVLWAIVGFFSWIVGVVIVAILPAQEGGKTATWSEEISSLFSVPQSSNTVQWLEEIPSIQYKHYHNKTGVAIDTTNQTVYLLEKNMQKTYLFLTFVNGITLSQLVLQLA